jgi:hypothetical protein
MLTTATVVDVALIAAPSSKKADKFGFKETQIYRN